ncbi:MAG: rhodanese-like domain-containing protein [Myxococcota bacterium]
MQGLKGFIRLVRNSIIIALIVTISSVIINFIHPHRIPFFATRHYEIYVPCPDTKGEIKEITVDEFLKMESESIIVDARSRADYEKWHFKDAINIEYDFLTPVCPIKIKEIINQKRRYVLVYGDGGEPDSGKELAKELATNGINNVFFLKGGVKELNR